jgi:hypothetical protein
MSAATAVLDLEKAGFTRDQVEALARFHESQLDIQQLATKADLKLELAELKAEILKWMIGLLLGQAAVIGALVKLR